MLVLEVNIARQERGAKLRRGGSEGVGPLALQGLDADKGCAEEEHPPPQEAHRGGPALVLEDLDVGEARGVVDGDVDELPADATATRAPLLLPRSVVEKGKGSKFPAREQGH